MRTISASLLAFGLFIVVVLVVVDPATWTLRNVSRETYGALILVVVIVLPWLAFASGMLDKKRPAA